MRLARICLLVVFAGLSISSTSFGAILITATYNLSATAQDNKVFAPRATDTSSGGLELSVHGDEFLEKDAIANHGDATAEVYATVRAQPGRVGIGFDGSIISTSGPFVGGVIQGASGGSVQHDAKAGWLEFIVPRVRNKAMGQPIVFNTLLVIEGSMGAAITGGQHNLPGKVEHYLEFFEDSTNSTLPDPPYGGSPGFAGHFWARQIEEPRNNAHILELPPDIIRVRHEMGNGLSYTLAHTMRLFGNADAANGGTTAFSADFSASLKWGGVESVTDLAGNPIPREDWSIESESGFDYSKPFGVPEPSSILLLGSLLCVKALRRSRRKLRSRPPLRDAGGPR
jgi:hypothetical protein